MSSGDGINAHATDPAVVAQQAAAIAAAWSPPGAPMSWWLTAAQFASLRDDRELLAIAAEIAPDRLPALLFSAAATSLVLKLSPHPLRDCFPYPGVPQPPIAADFRPQYRAFCLDHREQLAELCATHRYQMNEVGRCADLLPALAPAIAEGREIALVDIGTGAGLALHLDRYRYKFHGPGDSEATVGPEDGEVVIETEVRGSRRAPVAPALPRIADRVGIDVEPLDLNDPSVRAWLAACIPQEIGAVTRFHHAVDVAIANPARTVRGDALEVLPGVLAGIEEGPLLCLIDTYVNVFFTTEDLKRFRAVLDEFTAQRDLDWISIDPLVPLGGAANRTVLGLPAPTALVERNRREGLFGVIGRIQYRANKQSGALLGIAHPGAAWLEWIQT
ncbi:MAG: DUF2332 domain-containing protein [Solirubrobacteraceae bacterium]